VCRSLLEQGADPNSCQKMTPLANAVKHGHCEVAKLILMSGADPKKESQKKTPLEWAREGNFEAIVPLLEAAGICGGCAKLIPADAVKRCSKCKIVKFCSAECQKRCWNRFHRKQCTTWAERKDQLANRKH
jgi:ankyrin repeat protein